MKIIIKILSSLYVIISLSSCNKEKKDREYQLFNMVLNKHLINVATLDRVYEQPYKSKIINAYMKNGLKPTKDSMSRGDAVIWKIKDNTNFSHFKFTFMMKDEMYGMVRNNEYKNPFIGMLNANLNIDDFSQDKTIEFDRLQLPENCVRINSLKDTLQYKNHIFLGEFKFSRIMINYSQNMAFILVTTNSQYTKPNDLMIYSLVKKKNKWVIDFRTRSSF